MDRRIGVEEKKSMVKRPVAKMPVVVFKPLMPGDQVKILPGAEACWLDRESIDNLEKCFINNALVLRTEIETVYGTLNKKKMLDLGCGPACLLEIFPDMEFYIGVDQSILAISNAINRYPGKNFVYSRIENYRNPNQFDVITCIDVLQHLASSPEQLLRQILVLFDAKTFIFRALVNSLTEQFYYSLSTGHASISYPLSYFARLVKSVNEHTDCTAELKILSMPKKNNAEGIYIVCKRKLLK